MKNVRTGLCLHYLDFTEATTVPRLFSFISSLVQLNSEILLRIQRTLPSKTKINNIE